MLLFPILTAMSSTAGASNSPGMSSVKRIRLIGDDPLFLIVTDADNSCLRYEGNTVLLYFFAMLESRTSKVDASNSREPSALWEALGNTVYPKSHVKSGLPLLSTVTMSDSHRESGRTSSRTSVMSRSKSSLPFMLTCNLTKSTVKDERFSKMVLHSQLSGLSDSTELMYANPRQNASSSLNDNVESVASALYVALATPALIGLIPST